MRLFERRGAAREVRDPRAATARLQTSGRGLPQLSTQDMEQAVRQAYLQNSYVYACVQKLANAVAGAQMMTSRTPGNVSSHNPSSPLNRLLQSPAPGRGITARKLIAHSVVQRITTGQWAWEYDFGATNTGRPVALYPLISTMLKPIPSEGGAAYWQEFRYLTPGSRTAKSVTLNPSDLLYSWIPGQLDYRTPESPLTAARLDIAVAVMWDRYQYAFLKNDARPATIVVTPEFEEGPEYERFKRQFYSEYGGPDSAGKTAFAEYRGDKDKSSIEVIPIGQSQKDSQSEQIYKQKLIGICTALEVPMSLLDASGRTFNNGGIEVQNFYEGPVMRIAQDMADEINAQLAPLLGPDLLWFNFDHIAALRPPTKFMQVSPIELVANKIASKAEVREDLGLSAEESPADEAQPVEVAIEKQAAAALALVQAGYDPAGVLTAVGLPPIATAAKPEVKALPTETPLPGDTADPTARTAPATEARKVDRTEIRAAAARAAAQHTAGLEGAWERAFTGLFAKQRAATLDRINGKRGRRLAETRANGAGPDPSDVFDPAFWRASTADIATGLYDAVFAVGGARVSDQFGLSFDMGSPAAQEAIQARANQLAGEVTDTTYQGIKDALTEGVAAGESMPDLADRVGKVFDATPARSANIAQTEVISGYNQAKDLAASEMPDDVVAAKEWVATSDSRTRADHLHADGQIVAKDGPFRVGGIEMQYPGDPAAPADEACGCRCTVNHMSPEDAAAAGFERDGSEFMEYRTAVQAISDAASKVR